MTAEEIAITVLKMVRPDIYAAHPRSELEKMANGEALRELQNELEYIKEELAQFLCSYCGAPLTSRNEVELDADIGVSGIVERYACGYTVVEGSLQQMCPSDSRFPSFEDFKLDVRESNGEWTCYVRARTEMARYVYILKGVGKTEQEARDRAFRRL